VDHVKANKFFHHWVATPFLFYHTKRAGDIPTGTPLTGASNAGGVAEIAILSLYLALVPAVDAATSQVLSTESPVEHGQRTANCDTSLVVSGGFLREKTTKCL